MKLYIYSKNNSDNFVYITPVINSWLQDIAQMTGQISYSDIKDEVTQDQLRRLNNARRRWNNAAKYNYEDDYNEQIANKIGIEVRNILKGV